jgi:hypothetical protein
MQPVELTCLSGQDECLSTEVKLDISMDVCGLETVFLITDENILSVLFVVLFETIGDEPSYSDQCDDTETSFDIGESRFGGRGSSGGFGFHGCRYYLDKAKLAKLTTGRIVLFELLRSDKHRSKLIRYQYCDDPQDRIRDILSCFERCRKCINEQCYQACSSKSFDIFGNKERTIFESKLLKAVQITIHHIANTQEYSYKSIAD